MRRGMDLPTRNEIERQVTTSEEDLRKGAETLDVDARDVEAVRDVQGQLELGGIAEASDEIVDSTQRAEDLGERIFEQDDQSLEKTQEENDSFRENDETREESSSRDVKRLSETSHSLQHAEPLQELKRAENSAQQAVDLLRSTIEQLREARERSEQVQREFHARVRKG